MKGLVEDDCKAPVVDTSDNPSILLNQARVHEPVDVKLIALYAVHWRPVYDSLQVRVTHVRNWFFQYDLRPRDSVLEINALHNAWRHDRETGSGIINELVQERVLGFVFEGSSGHNIPDTASP